MIKATYFDHIKYGSSYPLARDADFIGDGVLDPDSDFALTFPSTPNMTCTVGAGVARVSGYRVENDGEDTVTLTFAAAHASLARIDLVQVGPIDEDDVDISLGLNQDLGHITVKTGTPHASPTQPTPDANHVALYAVAVAALQTTVTAPNVSDLRETVPLINVSASAAALPAGTIQMFAGSAAPTGWLFCNGASLLRADYPDLFAVIGTTYGAADGTHFTLPDLRGRTPIGVGTGAGLTARALAATGGAETHTLTSGEMPSHTHGLTAGGTKSGALMPPSATGFGAGPGGPPDEVAAVINVSDSTGGGTAHANMQPWLAVNFMIKY